jgi:hypothetical protein
MCIPLVLKLILSPRVFNYYIFNTIFYVLYRLLSSTLHILFYRDSPETQQSNTKILNKLAKLIGNINTKFTDLDALSFSVIAPTFITPLPPFPSSFLPFNLSHYHQINRQNYEKYVSEGEKPFLRGVKTCD